MFEKSILDNPIFDKIGTKARYLAIKLLVKTGRLTESTLSADDLNDLLDDQLPITLSISDNTGDGKLIVEIALLTMPEASACFHVSLSCKLKIAVLGNQVYEAALTAAMTAEPHYQNETKKIVLQNGALDKITILNDELTIMQQAQSSAEEFVPPVFREILKSSIDAAVNIFDTLSNTNTKENMEQIKSDSRQHFLDIHHNEIEEKLLGLLEEEDVCYQLDNTDIESRIFSEMGESTIVENGKLHFKFRK